MNKNLCAILFAMLSCSLLAQQATNAPALPADPAPAAPATNIIAPAPKAAPATKPQPAQKKAASKKAAAKPAALRTVPLTAGPAVVVANSVNVRGKATINSEVVSRLTKGQAVNVLEEVTLKNSGPDEPSAWARIQLSPTNTVWVHSSFIDAATKTVKPRKLNVRGGPGENYSVLGRLEKGEPVAEVETKGDWLRIQAPTNAYAFVAAQYLSQEFPATNEVPVIATGNEPGASNIVATATAGTNLVATASTNEVPGSATVGEGTPIVTAPVDVAAPANTNAAPALTNAPTEIAATSTNEVTEPPVEEPPPKRIVSREGLVRGTVSIQAPTKFDLVSAENGRLIDYLFTTSRDLDLQRYKGMRIIVTGEEALEERWGNTPVLTIQSIRVVE